jgi:hypothetical protein
MDKNAVFSHFSSIIDNMLENSLFFMTFLQRPSYIDTIYGSVDDPVVPSGLNIHFGATRGCIVDDDYDYVVKFDIDGDAWSDSICDRESEIYTHAKKRHLEQYFCEPVYLGCYNKTIMFYDYNDIDQSMDWYEYGSYFAEEFMQHEEEFGEIHPIIISIPLYAYPKAEYHHSIGACPDDDVNYINAAKKIHSPMRERNLAVAIDFIREYGEEAYQALTEFMYEEDINDLHGGNIGDVNGKMVFIDYSGYHSDCEGEYYSEEC